MESTLNLEQKLPIVEGQWGDWTQVCESAKPLDLIEIDRGNYQHWAMYLDSGYIVHVSQVDGRTEGKVAEKRVDTLQRIARSDRCRVNNLEAHAKAKGLKIADDEVICASISDVVGDEDLQNIPEEHCKIVPYNVYTKNCEYYATSWKYGRGFSAQVEDKCSELTSANIPPEVLVASKNALDEDKNYKRHPVNIFEKLKKHSKAYGSVMPKPNGYVVNRN